MPVIGAEIVLKFESDNAAGIADASLAPEVNTVGERVEEKVEREGKSLIITLKAKDLVALKAAVNSYINWVGLSGRVEKEYRGSGGKSDGGNKP